MKIVLLGYMASGKSSIGKRIAKLMNMRFVDLDDYIVEKEGKSINEIFSEKGEIYFRTIENTYLKKLLNLKEDFILSLGGGTPCYSNNMDLINQTENVESIYLRGNVNTLANKLIKKKSSRPLIASLEDEKIPEFVAKHLFERRFFYDQANYAINIDNKSKKEIALELKNLLN